MKGTVVSSWVESSRKRFSSAIVDEALVKHGFTKDYIFSPLEDVPDSAAKGIVEFIGRANHLSPQEIWAKMGEDNIHTFSELYPGFFRKDTAFQFLKSMNDVHAIVMKRFKGSVPPVLDLEVLSSREALFIYRSKRGMGDYLKGLIQGVAKHFNERIDVSEIKSLAGEMHLKLTFQKDISYTKNYRLNKLLSLGFIRKSSVKAALMTGLISMLLMLTPLGFGLSLKSALVGLVVFLIALLSNFLLSMPFQFMLTELNNLTKRRFGANFRVSSKDEFEELAGAIQDLKEAVKKDFIGFNSNIDEMYNFNTSVIGISEKMSETSFDIRHIIDQVANTATSQAESTEKLVLVLNEGIRDISQISEESQVNNNSIISAIDSLDKSFEDVNSTSLQILSVMEQFKDIKKRGDHLQDNAKSMNEIVSLVAGIASQINLLALNASIEASRAGDAGRGFAVVADEVRKLSVETNSAVEQIRTGLTSFVGDINSLVSGIDKQYGVLDSSSSSLSGAVEASNKFSENLKEVSRLMTDTYNRLRLSANSISTLYEPIQTLSASAEENSASAEEANSSVIEYVEQIRELSGQISVFNSLIGDFQEDLSSYKF